MQATTAGTKNVAQFRQPRVRHAKEDALTNLEFELLVDQSYELKPVQDLETRLILMVCGRLGLRRGELAHMREEWIDWRKSRIEIPDREPCLKGRDGGICAHCRQMARQKTDSAINGTASTLSDIYYQLARDDDLRLRDFDRELNAAEDAMEIDAGELLDLTDGLYREAHILRVLTEEYRDWHLNNALARRWEPKTDAAARAVPFSFSGRAEVALDRYFRERGYPQWMYTAQSINRRVKWVSDPIDEIGRVSPHVLRATAANFHAGRSVDATALQALMGWTDLDTAQTYIGRNPDNLERKLQFAHQ